MTARAEAPARRRRPRPGPAPAPVLELGLRCRPERTAGRSIKSKAGGPRRSF